MDSRPGTTAPAFWNGSEERPDGQRFRSLLDAVDVAVFHLDADGYVLGANTALSDATGYPLDEIRGAHVSRIATDETIERITCGSGLSDNGRVLDVAFTTVDGETIPFEVRTTPLFVDGRFQGTIGIGWQRPARRGSP